MKREGAASLMSTLDQSLAQTGGSRAERRYLTVLFGDMVGSSALSSRLDPEDLRRILRDFQSCCGDAVRDFEGHIARYMGDGLLAYFGYPVAHEDDAERAVQAGLQMVKAVSALTFPDVPPIEMRVGVATGLVVVGDLIGEGTNREFALIGEAPNLAARLQQLAGPNQVLVSHQTRRLLGRLFDLEDLGNHSIRGFEPQVRVWRVLKPSSVTSRFEARQSSRLTPLVGREHELEMLERRCEEVCGGKGQLIAISGEPGIGKSRLVTALKERLDGKMHWAPSFQCSSYHTSSAWYPIVRYLEDAAGIEFDAPASLRLEKLAGLVSRHLPERATSIVPLLAELMAIPTGNRYAPLELTQQQQKHKTYEALLALLQARHKLPLMLVFEDVHWIDPTSLEFLMWLREHIHGQPIIVLLLFRPEFVLAGTGSAALTSIALTRIDAAQATAMVKTLAEKTLLSPALVDLIVAKTDGVPLFIEEMTKAVLESGSSSEGVTVPDARSTFGVPDTLHDSLMARLDQFASMKTVAQIAATIGREFSYELLAAISPLSQTDLERAIDRLVSSGLLLRSDHPRDQAYSFKHALVQDEAYASLLRDQRRELHGKIARVLRQQFSEIGEASPEVIAHHLTEAHEIKPAIDYWLKAGKQASRRSAFIEAAKLFQIALDLLLQLPPSAERNALELSVQHALGSALAASKGFGAAETSQAFRRARELCEGLEASSFTISIANGLIGVHVARGEFEQSRALAEELLRRASQNEDLTSRLMAHRALGMSLFLIGDFEAARDELQSSLARHGPMPLVFSQDFKATAQAYLALTHVLLGNIALGVAQGQEALAHAEQLRHPHSICYALSFLAGAHVLCREPGLALPIAERTVVLSQEYGFPLWLAGGRMLRGWSRFDLGERDKGLAEIRESVGALEAAGAPVWVQFARYLLGQALAVSDQSRDAMNLIDQTLAEAAGTSGRWYEAELHRLKGDLLADQGDVPAAASCYETAVSVSARQGARLFQLRATNSLALLWRAQGQMSNIRSRLAPLYDRFDSAVMIADLAEARALLSEAA